MARNSEKAQTMLARYLRRKEEEERGPIQRRPFLAEECDDLSEAEKWRHQIIREISKAVTEIQNASIGEHRIRDLNDKINKLLREKGHWERQIQNLGGPNYAKVSVPMGGRAIEGPGGYMYFGAAKELPGVRELLEAKTAVEDKKPSRFVLNKRININYYGFRDDDDGVLEKLEAEAEKKLRSKVIEQWKEDRRSEGLEVDEKMEDSALLESSGSGAMFTAFIPTPSQEEIKQKLLAKKKKALLEKYGDVVDVSV
eukprot:151209_1